MPFNEDRLISPPVVNAGHCPAECYRQCSPESCPGLTAQCTDRCVVVTCLDDHQEACGDIICDDQSCNDPTDCNGIYEFLQCCDDYHDDFYEPKPHILDHHNTASTFNRGGWDPAFLLNQGYQHGHGHTPLEYYNGMATSSLTSTPSTATTMTVSSSRSASPSTPGPGRAQHHPYTHPNIYQPDRNQQQHIANLSPSFHNMNQPEEGLAFESSSSRSHDLSPVQSQSHLAPGPNEVPRQHACMWANCNAAYGSLQDLVAHVNAEHLQTVSASLITNNQLNPPRDPTSTHHHSIVDPTDRIFPSCHWGDCHVYPTVENVPGSSDRPFDAALDVLAAHLWEYHLGLATSSSQFNFPSATTSVAQTTGDPVHSSPPEDIAPEIQTSPIQVEMMDVALSTVPSSLVVAEADSIVDALTSSQLRPSSPHDHASPAQNQDRSHDHGHDCATTDHPCKWSGCPERFASCEALMGHITAEHVGGGKNHYGCFWDGCGRNGENGFKSKQKICRHLQSHTGHRPHQCEVCKHSFSEAATLQQHIRRHTQEKPYECDHPGCGKRFSIMGALTIHKRMHNGDKPFKCPQCDKAFSESSNLSKHLRTHTGARPYVCSEPGCGKCFGRGDQLTRHMNIHSGSGRVGKGAAVGPTKVA